MNHTDRRVGWLLLVAAFVIILADVLVVVAVVLAAEPDYASMTDAQLVAIDVCPVADPSPETLFEPPEGTREEVNAMGAGPVVWPAYFVRAPFPTPLSDQGGCWDPKRRAVQVSPAVGEGLDEATQIAIVRMYVVHEVMHGVLHARGVPVPDQHCAMARAGLSFRQLKWELSRGADLPVEFMRYWVLSEARECARSMTRR